MRVLIVKLSALGDVVHSLPVAVEIKRQVPEAQVWWVAESINAPLLEAHPAVDRVLVSPRYIWKEAGMGQAMEAMGRVVAELRAGFEAVIDLQGLIKSAFFVAMARSKRKIGFRDYKEKIASVVLNEPMPPYDPDRHAVLRYLDVLEPLGLERPAVVDFGLEWMGSLASGVMSSLGLEGKDVVVVHPMARWESKLWPEAHWRELIGLFVREGLSVVITGDKADQPVCARLGAAAGALDCSGRLGLVELGALMAGARAVVSTDTGPMHLAAGVGTGVVGLFGPTAPWRTGPFGSGHRVLRAGLECSPCFMRECSDVRCMREIAPKEVFAAAMEVVDGLGSGAS